MPGLTGPERDELVLSLLDDVTPLLRQYAARYRRLVSFDDLYQDACIHILRLIDASVPAHKLRHYSYNRVRSRIIDKLKYLRRRAHQSLDTSVFGQDQGGDETFGDMLPSPYYAEPPAILLAQERIADLLGHLANIPHGRVALAQELGASALASLQFENPPPPRAAPASNACAPAEAHERSRVNGERRHSLHFKGKGKA
ncbi:MAG TPA: sigma factor [Ktedonobacteraceae bacterium]|nr:sigma factor [Ktedonobacteraceae bacterium]